MENNYLKRFKENELRSCQLKQLEILKIFDRICRKHNLRYWIDGGTLLGAVRHKGFIPWDDDLDVAMPSPGRTIKNWIRSFRVNYRTICFGKPQKRIRQCLMVVLKFEI